MKGGCQEKTSPVPAASAFGIVIVKQNKFVFNWPYFKSTIILLCAHTDPYQLSDRDIEATMRLRGLNVGHSTVCHWVERYAPEINKPIWTYLKMNGTSHSVVGTDIKIGKSC